MDETLVNLKTFIDKWKLLSSTLKPSMLNVDTYGVKGLHLKAIALTPCPSSNTILSSASSTAKLGKGEEKTKSML